MIDDARGQVMQPIGRRRFLGGLAAFCGLVPLGLVRRDARPCKGPTRHARSAVEVVLPFQFTETHGFYDKDVTSEYRRAVFALVGRTNNGPFRGLAAGEVLLLGVMGGKDKKGRRSITFRFAAPVDRGPMPYDSGDFHRLKIGC